MLRRSKGIIRSLVGPDLIGWLGRAPIPRKPSANSDFCAYFRPTGQFARRLADHIGSSKLRFYQTFRREWLTNIPTELLSGVLVALALIPEAIGFSIVAGVDPKVGLYASFSIAVVTAIVGGRPAMISAATASTAVLMITLVRDHGLQYLFAATVLMGDVQIVAGALAAGTADEVRLAIGHDGLRQCARDPDLPGPNAAVDACRLADLRHGRRRFGHHLSLPLLSRSACRRRWSASSS